MILLRGKTIDFLRVATDLVLLVQRIRRVASQVVDIVIPVVGVTVVAHKATLVTRDVGVSSRAVMTIMEFFGR